MSRKHVFAVAATALALAACDGFKEAMSAHVEVVARAGNQELSVRRLAELLGNAKDAPVNRDAARVVAEYWVSYQLLAEAAAKGDSFNKPDVVDKAMWAAIANAKVNAWYEVISKQFPGADSSGFEGRYNQGELLAARHILIAAPKQGLSTAARDSIRRRAEAIRRTVTAANFRQMVQQHTQEPGGKERGGDLGIFRRGDMVPTFERGVLALRPGEVSPIVESDFGYHIIYRPTYSEVKNEFDRQVGSRTQQVAESTYRAKMETGANLQLKPNAAQVAKQVAGNLDAHRDDKTVIATSKYGEFTAGDVARWVAAYPPNAQIPQRMAGAPDSAVAPFVKMLINNEMLLRQADSAKVQPDTVELARIRRGFTDMVGMSWAGLGVSPNMLADSARTTSEKERLAASRVENYMDRLLNNNAQFVQVSEPLRNVLRDRYEWKINDAGLDRAVERAAKIRAVSDSARTRQTEQAPPSAVPMPGQGNPPGAPQVTVPPAQKQP